MSCLVLKVLKSQNGHSFYRNSLDLNPTGEEGNCRKGVVRRGISEELYSLLRLLSCDVCGQFSF